VNVCWKQFLVFFLMFCSFVAFFASYWLSNFIALVIPFDNRFDLT